MKLTDQLWRLSNYLRFRGIPGNILVGNHRIWPKLTPKYKRHLERRIDTEIHNMKLTSVPFINEEQSRAYNLKVKEEVEKNQFSLEIELTRANKNKMRDRLMSEHLDGLRNNRVWE